MVGSDHVLAAILDPLHRPAQPHCSDQHQNILRVDFSAHAEAATDVRLKQMNSAGTAAEHPRQRLAISVRHFGSPVQFEHVARGIVASDRATGLQRHAGMPTDGNVDFYTRRGIPKCGLDISITLPADRRLRGQTGGKFRDGKRGVGDCLELLDLDGHEVSSVLRHVGIGREHRCHRFADIAHLVPGQNTLPERCQLFVGSLSEVDGRQIGDVVRSPDGDDTFDPARLGKIDSLQVPVRV